MTIDFREIGQRLLDEAYTHGEPQPESAEIVCSTCNNARWVKGERTVTLNGHHEVNFSTKPCPDCQRPLADRLAQAGVRKTFAEWQHNAALDEARAACEAVLNRSQWCLLMRGAWGIGESHLAEATCVAWIERGGSAKMINVPDFLSELRKAIDTPEDSIERHREAYQDVGLLVLDDWRGITKWAEGEMYQVVDYRYRKKLPLIVTTNIKGMDPAVASRLSTGLVEIKASDQRKRFDGGSHG